MSDGYKTGFVAFLGKPNAGKSTLLNALVGAKLAAVSALPQTTRERFAGIHSDDERQIIFVDLPGLTLATDRLNECLRLSVLESLNDVDLVVHLIDVADPTPVTKDVEEALSLIKRPMLLVVNKIDGKRAKTDAGSWAGENLSAELRKRYVAIVGISAAERKGLDVLLLEITQRLPEGPPLYDTEIMTDRDLRYLSQEMIREKAFIFLHEELPYATAVQVDEFVEREQGKWYIRATIYVERESQKGMVIGKNGEMLRKISKSAREEIEKICDAPVFLDLWVKVREKWRKNDYDLRMFGFSPPKPARKKKKR